MLTTTDYSPWNQLPAPEPKTKKYSLGHFYNYTAKHLIKDTVRIMDNGLNIDIDKVIELEKLLVEQLAEVQKELEANPLIKKYLKVAYKKQIKEYITDRKSKMKSYKDYLVPFKHTDINHRSYFMEEYAKLRGWSSPPDKLPTGVGKWPALLARKYAKSNRVVAMMLKGKLPENTEALVTAMKNLSVDKAEMYNKKYVEQVKTPDKPYPKFNPGSPQQKQELFAMLGIKSEAFSKATKMPSWDREQVERVNKETQDKDVKNLTQNFIDHSFAAIIKSNFIESFYTYTVQGRLYGQYKLIGAKSGRYTSSNPNMLNAPSTASRFAKAVKRCLTAPARKVILAADYAALEDRVIAALSRDTNKCAIFLNNLDGHSLNALGYFREEIAKLVDLVGDPSEDAKIFKAAVDAGNIAAEKIRQVSKGPTFKLAYGGYPDADKGGVITQEIFDNYHTVLYPGITDYRENYVLATALKMGEIHLGLGFTIKTDDADRDIRTITNATCQFWSILTAIAINKMHHLIDEAGYQNDVKVISTIYDSIYLEVTETPEIIKWSNDNLINTMLVDFMEDQAVHNECDSDIGYNWADMLKITNNAPISEIKKVLANLER